MDNDELCLHWTEHTSSFMSTLSALHSSSSLSDVVLSCDNQDFEAHKLVLATCSEYFESLFSRNGHFNVPGLKPVIVIRDAEAKHLQALIKFMYCGTVVIHEQEIAPLLNLAKNLRIKGLGVTLSSQPNTSTLATASAETSSFSAASSTPTRAVKRSATPSTTTIKIAKYNKEDSNLDESNVTANLENMMGNIIEPKRERDDETIIYIDQTNSGIMEFEQEIEAETDNDTVEDGNKSRLYEEEELPECQKTDLEFRKIEGKKRDSVLYVAGNKLYVVGKRYRNRNGLTVICLRCRHTNAGRKCNGTALLKNGKVAITHDHQCSDNHLTVLAEEARNGMRKLAQTTTWGTARDIYHSVISNRTDLEEYLPYEKCKNLISKWRRVAVTDLANSQ